MIRNLRRTIRKNRGFTLVELMIVVAIVGILAALAIYGVTRYMKNAKTAEARNSIGQMSKDAASAYSRETGTTTVLNPGVSSTVSNALCTTATKTVPAAKGFIAGKKYQSQAAEWAPAADAATAGFKCLKFSMDQPQYFMYNYVSPNVTTFTSSAQGDLDADGVLSTFSLAGAVQAGGIVAISPSILEVEPEE